VQQAKSSGAAAGSVVIVMAGAIFVRAGASCRHDASGTYNAEHVTAHQNQPDHPGVVPDAVALIQS